MNEQPLKQEYSLSTNKQLERKLETLIDQVWNDLQGKVSRGVIQKVLLEIIPKYKEARVTTFVPIFIRRDTVNALRASLVQAEVEPTPDRNTFSEQTTGRHNPRGVEVTLAAPGVVPGTTGGG